MNLQQLPISDDGLGFGRFIGIVSMIAPRIFYSGPHCFSLMIWAGDAASVWGCSPVSAARELLAHKNWQTPVASPTKDAAVQKPKELDGSTTSAT